MAFRKLYSLAFFATIAFTANAQPVDTAFKKEWIGIDTIIVSQDLTRTALDKVNVIYQKAKKQQLQGQVIKCLLYQYNLQERVTSKDPNPVLKKIEQELSETNNEVQKAILHSLLAKLYKQYFDRHRWNLYGRKKTSGVIKEDITTWGIDDFSATISKHYLLSLAKPELLKQKKTDPYNAVIIKGNIPGQSTLFDLLAHEALIYFKTGEASITKAADLFLLTDTAALGNTAAFIHAAIPAKDSSSHGWITLQLFRQLLLTHLQDPDKTIFIENNLERIEWVYSHSNFSHKEIHYKRSLEDIAQANTDLPVTAQAWYLLAKIEYDKAVGFSPFADTTQRYGYVLAKQIAENALSRYKENSRGTANLKNLLLDITHKELSTQTETVNIPGKPFRALVSYRNVDTVYGKILRLDKDIELSDQLRAPGYWKTLRGVKAYRSFTQPLPATHDFQLHNVEIRIDELPVGEYALICSGSKGFDDSTNKLSIQAFYVSNISYIQNKQDVFVLNRETGKPMANVKATIYQRSYLFAQQKNTYNILFTKTTDEKGYFHIDQGNRYYNLRYSFSKGDDHLYPMKDEYFYPDYNEPLNANYERVNSRVFMFTDRSIYRPGQLVFFKGIAVTKDQNTRLSKLITSRDSSWVILFDANNKKIDSIRFALNDFGSFNGKFRLPSNGLTGNFSIHVPEYNMSGANFSVEEYKRPTFDVKFEKTKGAYRLQDSVTITGNALAYAGNAIAGAKVVYTVKRTTRYAQPIYWRRPTPGNSREISHGETKTDVSGKFSIAFKALADDILDRTGNPLFDFSITADITDISGETRSSQANITVGFSSLLLNINAPAIAETDSLKGINISTTNLSYEKEPAIVQLKVYALVAPEQAVRKRYWARPDQFVMDKKEFNRYFPTDEYEEESNYQTWATGELVTEGTIDTKEKNTFGINKATLKPGYYKIEAHSVDQYGESVNTVQFIRLFDRDPKAKQLSGLLNYTLNGTAKPGETAVFLSGRIADHLYVIRKTDRAKKDTGLYQFLERNKGIETIQYIPDETDRGGVYINEAYVFDNRVYTQQYAIDVPWNNKKLEVQYASYRNKTEPGSKEQWSVTVQTDQHEAAAAELVTGMYDASLDQFKQHSWAAPNIWENNYSRSSFSGITNFGAENGFENSMAELRYDETDAVHDQLVGYASELWNRMSGKPIVNPSGQRIMAFEDFTSGYAALNETVIVGKGIKDMAKLPSIAPGANASIQLRGSYTTAIGEEALYIVDGKETKDISNLDPNNILSLTVLNGNEAAAYGSKGTHGVIVVVTKTGSTPPVQPRKNFNETAFFFPQLYADSSGKYSFSFTMPEALTQWKWMSFAHTRDLAVGNDNTTIVTQKKMMIQPNAPRFLREGDVMEFSAKIVNMSDQEITGQVSFELVDATTNTSVDGWFQNVFPSQYFTVEAGKSFPLKFPLQVPFSFNRPLTWRIIAKAGEYSDGEENTLPVLTNRVLVTESLPLFLQNDTTQQFKFDKLIHAESESLSHEGLTVEYTSNPVWYAVQALPYLMEYPYECVEQTFNRFYANSLASFIINKNPKIKQVFEQWKADSSSLKSNLQKNEDLKQVLLQETPWVMQAESEEQQKKNIALLFDMIRLSSQTESLIERLSQLQLADGGFSWFKGGTADRYMTNYVLTGIGKLKRLGALSPEIALRIRNLLVNAIRYSDGKIAEDYNRLIKNKADLGKQQISSTQIDYLYMRSFFRDIAQQSQTAYDFYYRQGKQFWIKQNSYYRAQLGLVFFRNNEEKFATATILPALEENAINDPKLGMYWKSTYTGYWYQSPIEHQSMMIAFMSEINNHELLSKNINAMKTWLLLNKQTSNWKTTVATADACYALLLNGSDWLNTERKVTIQLGNYTINSSKEKTEAGTGYFKKRIEGKQVTPEMGNIMVTAKSSISQFPNSKVSQSPSWGSVYWQYFEDMDKVTSAASPLSLHKNLFIEKNTDKGKVLELIKEGEELKTGDKVVIRMELRSDRDMDYVHLKDMRASSMEPVNVLSSYKWQDGLGYYESTKDASSNFFFSHLPKGTYVFEYPVFITHTGLFSVGLATIQCMYAPEFTSHSEGVKIRVSE